MGIFTRILGLFTQEAVPEAAADYYDLFAGRIVPTLYSGFVDAVVRELRCGKILDVGTGPGYVPIEIAKRNEEVFVDGIDLTRKFREIGERNARNAGVSARVHFETGDATKMPFDDNSYDVVISTGAMHHWKYPARVIDEMYRVLKPGGRTVFCEVVLKDKLPENVRKNIDDWFRCIGGALPEKEFIALMEGVGFRNIQVISEVRNARTGHPLALCANIRAYKV